MYFLQKKIIMRNTFIVFMLLLISTIYCSTKPPAPTFFLPDCLGVKIWNGGGISLKHFFSSNNAGELIGYFTVMDSGYRFI